ncbi:uncharacterized protein [Solanum lycopersicum]|uniref:uncharacterized protein n=1 Tax=Solanum lycopersicum TaxID=4081 RepID=UPI00374A84F1
MDGESLSQISSQIDGEVTGCENSGDPTIAIAGINGVSVEKKYSHCQSTHVTTQPHQIDREINNNNITSSQTDHKFDEQQENHESAGEHSRCIRKDTRNVTANATSVMEAKARINENNRGRNTSPQLTPNLYADNPSRMYKKEDKGRNEQGKSSNEDTAKNANQPTKNQKGGTGQAIDLNQAKTQRTRQQQKTDKKGQTDQGQQREKYEEQWQTQKKKHQKQEEQISSKSVWRPVTQPMQGTNDSKQQEQAIAANKQGSGNQEKQQMQAVLNKLSKTIKTMVKQTICKLWKVTARRNQDQHLQKQNQNRDSCKQNVKEKTVQQQTKKKEGTDQGEQSGNIDVKGTPKSKNKTSKQKRDAEKRRQSKQQGRDSEHEQGLREKPCNRFVMVDDNHGLDITPLQIQYMNPSTAHHPYKQQQKSQVLPQHMEDEYVVLNSEDDMVGDDHYLDECDDND